MSKYSKEDILRLAEEEEIEFIASSVYRYFWYAEKRSNHSGAAAKGFG